MEPLKRAAILTIGDELLIGQIVDSNSAWIAAFMDRHGWKVTLKATVGDTLEQIIAGIDLCRQHAELLILTGGLGPTKDDLTVEALTQYFHTRRVWHEETWQRILQILQRIKREPSEMHRPQCYLPESAELIANDRGSAPGMIFRQDGIILVSMPGVPSEMKHLLQDKIIHLLPQGAPVQHRFIRTAGEGETVLAEMIRDIEDALPPSIRLAYLPSYGYVTLRLTTHDPSLSGQMNTLAEQISARLGKLVYGTGDTTLAKAIGEILRQRKETIGTAESCTGGYLAHMITTVPGSSDYYMGSIIPYSYELKTVLLDIPDETLQSHGAVSEEVIRLMASRAREKLGVTWTIATSGIAGPGGATPTKPVGTIWLAVAGPGVLRSRLIQFNRDRIGNIESAATSGLILLWKTLTE